MRKKLKPKIIFIFGILLISFLGCKSSRTNKIEQRFKYKKYELSKNPDSSAFNLSGYIFKYDSLPSSGNFGFDNNYPIYRHKTSNGYESILMAKSSPIHNADENGYFSFDFDNEKDIIMTFGLCCADTIKPQLGKKLVIMIYLDEFGRIIKK